MLAVTRCPLGGDTTSTAALKRSSTEPAGRERQGRQDDNFMHGIAALNIQGRIRLGKAFGLGLGQGFLKTLPLLHF